MKTVYFEQVNGYLVRLYDRPVDSDSRIKYHGVVTIEIDKDKAVAKGMCGTISKRNKDDISAQLKEMGVIVVTWERYDHDGRLLKSSTVKLF